MVKTQKRRHIKGGSNFFGPSFTDVPIHAFYPLNQHNPVDVSDPSSYTNSRLLMGGKRRQRTGKKNKQSKKNSGKKSKKTKKNSGKHYNSKKQRGGDGFLNNLSLNAIAGQGNYQNYSSAYNILSGTSTQTPGLSMPTTSYLV